MKDSDIGGSAGPARDGPVSGVPETRRARPEVTDPIQRKARRPLPQFTGLRVPDGTANTGYNEFLPAVLQVVYTPPALGRRVLAYALAALITAAILWSIFGYLRLFAIAPGELEVRGGSQVVEPLEPGQVSALPVHEGSHVEKGSIVVQLDPTAAIAAKTITESKLVNAKAEAIRHRAAASLAAAQTIDKAAPLAWMTDIPSEVRTREESVLHADLAQLAAAVADLQAKLNSAQATRDKFIANIAAQKVVIESLTKRTAMHETLATQGWDSRAMVLQSLEPLRKDQVQLANYQGSLTEANAMIPVLQDQMAQARKSFIADNVDAAAIAERQAADLTERLKAADLALANLTLCAPVTGSVRALAVTSVGQFVKGGAKLMQVVPDGVPLEIQAYVLNTDIGFVKVGQPVTIKVDTFPFTRYGTIEGRVSRINADAITGKYAVMQQKDDTAAPTKGAMSVTNAAQPMKDLVFPVTIVPNTSSIRVEGRDVPLSAGMSVVVEIETERQRAIFYIVHPLTRFLYGGMAKE